MVIQETVSHKKAQKSQKVYVPYVPLCGKNQADTSDGTSILYFLILL
jgi:hypothetical protein